MAADIMQFGTRMAQIGMLLLFLTPYLPILPYIGFGLILGGMGVMGLGFFIAIWTA